MTVRTTVAALLLAAACNPPDPQPPDGDGGIDAMPDPVQRTEVVAYKAIANPDLDLLFVIDDSPSMLDKQTSLKAAFPSLIAQLSSISGGVPNLHLGVISTDMGTKGSATAAAGPSIGQIGQGGCAGTGKNGALQKGTSTITGAYLSLDRSGAKNFTGTLAGEFSAMASLGAGGCGFEQTLHALRRGLDPATNPGFLRTSANLAVVILTDEDDCSLLDPVMLGPETSAFGPLQSFRCFRFGVECAEVVNQVGAKTACKPRKLSPYVEDIGPFRDALLAAKGNDARHISLGVIAGTTTPVQVELRTPPGGGTAETALAHSCAYTTPSGSAVADPPVRLAALAAELGSHGTLTSVCSDNLAPAAIAIGEGIKRLVGDTCLTRTIADPTSCIVEQTFDNAPGTRIAIQRCASGIGGLCYDIVDDAACADGPHQRLSITRSDAPANDAWITLSCAP